MDFVARVPKAELHCHGWAVVDPAILTAIRDRGHNIPISPEDLSAATPTTTFAEFTRWHRTLQPLRTNFEAFKVALQIHVDRLKLQNVTYAEIMFGTSPLGLNQGLVPDDAAVMIGKMQDLQALANGTGTGDPATQVEFMISLTTKQTLEITEAWVKPLIQMYEAGAIVGITWVGLDQGGPIAPLAECFGRLHEAGVPFTIHAGEFGGPERVWEAIEQGHATRVGHGIAAFHDPNLLDLLRERQIHLELCPTSNVRTGVVPSIEEHPLRQALDLGLNFSINSDDPGTLGCTVESEYRLAAEAFGFSEGDLLRVTSNAIASRFGRRSRVPIQAGGTPASADIVSGRS